MSESLVSAITTTDVVLMVLVGYLLRQIWAARQPAYVIPAKHPETVVFREFTPKELALFNGIDKPSIYIAVKRSVFDVSGGKAFYGQGGMYENFAGRDASRGLAKNSFDKTMLTSLDSPIDALADLTADEQEALDGWFSFFQNKYPIVGKLISS